MRLQQLAQTIQNDKLTPTAQYTEMQKYLNLSKQVDQHGRKQRALQNIIDVIKKNDNTRCQFKTVREQVHFKPIITSKFGGKRKKMS